MKPRNNYDLVHRKYYLDHPSSINHHEPYIVSLENQYSVLSQSRNPYHVLDHLNFQMSNKYNGLTSSHNKYENESLDKEIKQWTRKQQYKDRQYRSLKGQLKDLSNLLKKKDSQYERDKMNNEMRMMMINQSKMMSVPMYMPFGMGGGCPHSQMMNFSGCHCQCQHQCHNYCQQYSCQHSSAFQSGRPQRPTKPTYRPVHTEQAAVQSPSLKSVKISKKSLPSNRTVIAEPKQVVRVQKRKRTDLLRRFRKCVYAVYFCIYFKWFSSQFTVNRYSRFKKKYLDDSGKDITSAYKQVYERMLSIDIPGLARDAVQTIPQKGKGQLDITTLLKGESIKKYNSLSSKMTILTTHKETLFLRCAQFINSLLYEVERLLGQWQWGDMGEALCVGALNKSFMIDNYFLPHQIYLVLFHQKKGYAQIKPEHERMQAMIKFVVKVLLFNVCFQLDNNRYWMQLHEEEMKKQDMNEFFIFLEICSKMIFVICQYMYERQLEGQQTNYDQVPDRFKIEPCNPLVYSYSIKKRRQLFKSEVIKDSNLLIYGVENLDEINSIMNETFYKDAKKGITDAIDSLINQTLNKLKESNTLLYKQLWNQTLDDEYIILRGMKKIMKSTRYYPFISNTIIPSKKSINASSKSIALTSKYNRSQIMTYKSDVPYDRSSLQKISIARRIPRR